MTIPDGTEGGKDQGRGLRADAARNRQRLVETAKAVFAEKGAGASLEEIARTAGVGIGTLYRHFPTRDALIEEVYRNASAQLGKAAERLSAELPPVEALRAWLLLFVDHMATKKIMADALASLVGGTAELYATAGAQMKASIAMLVERAVASGEIRAEMEPLDLLRALAGVSNVSADAQWEGSARRLVDILVAGLRTAG